MHQARAVQGRGPATFQGMETALVPSYTDHGPPPACSLASTAMTYEQDAFISYAHIDNEPISAGQKGWVTQFHATLQTMLSQRMGERARIWRDDKLAGDDVFADEIVAQFNKTALLVSILSPRYLRSEWCTRELHEFCAAVERGGNLGTANKSRVFKIVKTPLDPGTALPAPIQATLGYEFYEEDGGAPRELDPAFGDEARQEFLSRISRLAWSLAQSLQQLRALTAPAAAAAATAAANQPLATAAMTTPPARPTVYLAHCGRDLNEVREQLATELRMHGHEVLPTQPLPQSEELLLPELDALLARCAVAVHLVGRSVGPVPDGPSGRSLTMLQNDCAARRCEHSDLRRIIWLPTGVSGERAEQQTFIDALQREATLQLGADLLRGDVEALKGTLHRALELADTPKALPAATGQTRVHVLMCETDRTASVPLLKRLRAQGLQVSIPVFTGDAAALRKANAELVADGDGLILFYGAGDEVWKFHQQSELRKQAALRGGAGGTGGNSEWVWLAAPMTADKELLQLLGDTHLLDGLTEGGGEVLQPFFASLAVAAP